MEIIKNLNLKNKSMKITAQELISEKNWLHKCILESINVDVIDDARDNHDFNYDIKMVVNGHELEPELLNKLITNIVAYIELEALDIVNTRMQSAVDKAKQLENIVQEASDKIRDEFGIEKE